MVQPLWHHQRGKKAVEASWGSLTGCSSSPHCSSPGIHHCSPLERWIFSMVLYSSYFQWKEGFGKKKKKRNMQTQLSWWAKRRIKITLFVSELLCNSYLEKCWRGENVIFLFLMHFTVRTGRALTLFSSCFIGVSCKLPNFGVLSVSCSGRVNNISQEP